MTDTPQRVQAPDSDAPYTLETLEDFNRFEKLLGSFAAMPADSSTQKTVPGAGATELNFKGDAPKFKGDTLVIPPIGSQKAQDKYLSPAPLSILPPLESIFPVQAGPGRKAESQANPYAMQEQSRTGADASPVLMPPLPEFNKVKTELAVFKAAPDGKIEISEKDFDKIGPKAAQVLKDAGVSKITITPGNGYDTYEAELKKPIEIAQDPAVDGCRKLKIADKFKAEVSKDADGSFKLDKIEGLTAETKVLFKWQDASVDRIKLKQTPDGKSEITSTGSWNGFSRDNTRVKPGDIFDKAKILFERMDSLRK